MNNNYLEILVEEEPFFLLPQKAIFRPFEKQLIVCDVYFGKSAHFRKQGIAIPPESHLKDFETLQFLLRTWKPESVMVLGDLFHSHYNKEWWWFKSLLLEHPNVQFILVEGNHDILEEEIYSMPNLLKAYSIEEGKFAFSHYPLKESAKLNICGHIHPGLRLTGLAKQSQILPCFFYNRTHFILPAFGNLTGLKLLDREKGASYYIVTEEKVVEL